MEVEYFSTAEGLADWVEKHKVEIVSINNVYNMITDDTWVLFYISHNLL